MATSSRWASWRLPMVGTRPTRRPCARSRANASRSPLMVWNVCMAKIPDGRWATGLLAAAEVILGEVFKAGVLAEEGQPAGADGAVALLADDHLGDALVLGILVVDLVAVDEQDDVGVLLDGAGFP